MSRLKRLRNRQDRTEKRLRKARAAQKKKPTRARGRYIVLLHRRHARRALQIKIAHAPEHHVRWLVIDGCPAPYYVAAQIYLVLRRAGQTASSINRSTNPVVTAILHRYGKHNQAEIHRMLPAISNPAGFSEHELKSDGGAANNGIPRGKDLPYWMQGVDSGDDDEASKERIRDAAAHFGWKVEHPYSAGVEGHHWRFDAEPKPRSLKQKALLVVTRARLPRR